MIKLSLKIWGLANGIVFLVFFFSSLPAGLGVGLLALFYSALFSLPAIVLSYFLLAFLRLAQGPVLFSWAVLLVVTALMAYVPYLLCTLWLSPLTGELNFILPLSFISGYSSILLLSPSLHYLFKTFYYEAD